MSGNPALDEMQRWSAEVARDPSAPAFLPLARAYRRQGQLDAAMRVCTRALERHPTHIEGHALLAGLYLESGDRERACDEWSTVLRLDPGNFDAHRGMGFAALERADLGTAQWHLEQAAAARPMDPAVREALAWLRERLPRESAVPAPGAAAVRDPSRLFEFLLEDPVFLGALVVDARGLVLAGTLAHGDGERVEALGAVLGEAVEEAVRTVEHLALGAWSGFLLETDAAVLHIAPLSPELFVLVAARRDAPAGWIRRTAVRAAERARDFIEGAP
ncbi:MAG TPA: tetratricopeptide repeat protein [Longimicrobiales bacterium]